MDSIRLAVPERSPNPGVATYFNASRLKAWLESLPLGNPAKTAEELLKALQQVNRAEAATNQRYYFLDQCRPLIADILESLHKQYASAAVPLAEKQMASANLAHGLLNEMAYGYKIVILATAKSPDAEGNRNMLIASSLHAMHYLSRLCVDIYSLYTPEPKNLWLELHQLYALAERQGFLTATLQNQGKDNGIRSIDHAYRRILMLALANPYHLMQGEAMLVFQELDHWASTCRISPLGSGASPKGHLFMDLDKDAAPRYIPTSMNAASHTNGRILDISASIPIIEQRNKDLLVSSKTDSGQLNLAGRKKRNLYKRLTEAWGIRTERLSERKKKSKPVDIVIGISACHHFANRGSDFKPEVSEIEIRKGKNAGQTQDGLSLMAENDTPWLHEDQVQRLSTGIVQPRTSQFETDHAKERDIWVKVYSTQAQFNHEHSETSSLEFESVICQLRDESRGGMAISCKKARNMRLTAGEIIGYKSDNTPSDTDWSIGVVRWLRASPPDNLELGIRCLADDTLPVATRGVKGVGKDSEYFRSLLIPKMDPTQYPTTLITPASVYDVDSVIFVNTGTQLFYAKLTKLIDATNSFSLFQFQVTDNV